MNTIQFIGTTPQDLVTALSNAIIPQIKAELSKEFQPKQPEELLTIDEMCAMLKIDRSTEHRWRKKGVVKPSLVEGSVYYFRSEIEKLLNDNKLK